VTLSESLCGICHTTNTTKSKGRFGGCPFWCSFVGPVGTDWRRKEPWPQKPFSLHCCLGSNRDLGSGALFPPTPRGRRGGQRASNRPITFKWIGLTRQESSAGEWCTWAAHPLQWVQRIISTNAPMLSAIELGCDQPTQFDRIVPGRSLRRAPFLRYDHCYVARILALCTRIFDSALAPGRAARLGVVLRAASWLGYRVSSM
jgi:hypothetical protein